MPGPTTAGENGLPVKAAIGLKSRDLNPVFLTMQMGNLLAIHESNGVHVLSNRLLFCRSGEEHQRDSAVSGHKTLPLQVWIGWLQFRWMNSLSIRPRAKSRSRARAGLLSSNVAYWSRVIAATSQSSTGQAPAERGLASKNA